MKGQQCSSWRGCNTKLPKRHRWRTPSLLIGLKKNWCLSSGLHLTPPCIPSLPQAYTHTHTRAYVTHTEHSRLLLIREGTAGVSILHIEDYFGWIPFKWKGLNHSRDIKSRLIRVITRIDTQTLYSQETNGYGLNSSIQYIEVRI